MTAPSNARRISALKNLALMLAAALLVALIVLPGTPASADHFGGPVILTGIDAEDCGPGDHGPIETWIGIVQNGILANTTNGDDGILVIGAHRASLGRPGPIAFWNAIGAGTGETITFGDGNSSFEGYQMIAVVGREGNTCGGLTKAENTVLTARAAEVAAFVNGGGGLLVNDQTSLIRPEQYSFIAGLGAVETARAFPPYFNIDPTPAGLAVGVNDTLDVDAWHITFTKFPDFLEPLAYQAGTQNVAALGGAQVMFPVTPGGEFPPHPPPPPPPPGLLDSVTALVNPEPSPTPSPSPSPTPGPTADVDVPAVADTTPPPDELTGTVPSGGVAAGGGGTASDSGARTAAIMLVLFAAIAHFMVFVRRKTGAG